jgi:hypothetical protein
VVIATSQSSSRPQRPRGHRGESGADVRSLALGERHAHARHAPIVAVVEPHSVRVTSETAARVARALGASLAFVYVRPRRPAPLENTYQRSLSRDLMRGLKVLQTALAVATSHGVMAHGEIVEEFRSHANRGHRRIRAD